MTDLGEASPLVWHCKHLSASNSSVPASPGVYAIGSLNTLHGLDLKREYLYIGKTMNLQRRMNQHLPGTEQNPELHDYLLRNYTTTMCWYAQTKVSRIKEVEDDLIHEIQPKFNTIGVPSVERKQK